MAADFLLTADCGSAGFAMTWAVVRSACLPAVFCRGAHAGNQLSSRRSKIAVDKVLAVDMSPSILYLSLILRLLLSDKVIAGNYGKSAKKQPPPAIYGYLLLPDNACLCKRKDVAGILACGRNLRKHR
jgi:hypothetical protein